MQKLNMQSAMFTRTPQDHRMCLNWQSVQWYHIGKIYMYMFEEYTQNNVHNSLVSVSSRCLWNRDRPCLNAAEANQLFSLALTFVKCLEQIWIGTIEISIIIILLLMILKPYISFYAVHRTGSIVTSWWFSLFLHA